MLKKICIILVLSLIGIPLLSDASLSAPLPGESARGIISVDTTLHNRIPAEPSGLLQPVHAPLDPSDVRPARSPSLQGNRQHELTGDGEMRIENTPLYIDPSLMNTPEGGYSTTRGYGWELDEGGNFYFKITLSGTSQYPTEFYLKSNFTTKARFGIFIKASHVRVSGIDLTAGSAGDQPVHTITNTYEPPMTLSETGAAGIKVGAGSTNVKLVNMNVTNHNFPAIHVDSADVEIIGTNNPDPYLTSYSGGAVNEAWGSAFHSQSQGGYGLGLQQNTNYRSSSITVRGSGGTGVSFTGPFSGIEVNGNAASLSLTGDHLYINGTGTGSDRNSGITAWSGTVRVNASDSSILGQEYGIYANKGTVIEISCPGCSLGPVGPSAQTAGRDLISLSGGGRTVIQGGTHGLVLSDVSTSSSPGRVSIDNVLVQGLAGNGIHFSDATRYNLSVSDPSVIQGGSGKLGLSGGSQNVVSTGNLTFRIGSQTPPYLISVLLDSIPGPDPFNVRIFDEDGEIIHDISDWNRLPPGVVYDPDAHLLSFEYPAIRFFSGEKYARVQSPTVSGITPSTGYNTGRLTTIITGTNFRAGVKAHLTRGATRINGVVSAVTGIRFNAAFPLLGAPSGVYTLTVTNTDLTSATGTFTVRAEQYSPFKRWGTPGSANNQFRSLKGIAVDKNGFIYVADTGNNRIQKFNSNGRLLKTWGTKGAARGKFLNPSDIAVDRNNNVYVADTGNNRIQKFNSNGRFLRTWGTKGAGNNQLRLPSGIGVDKNCNVYVADTNNHRIVKYNQNGKFMKKWGARGNGNGRFISPRDVAVDNRGFIYVADTGNNRIQKLRPTGAFLTKWGTAGAANGRFRVPSSIDVDSNNFVYVADTNNHRIQKFSNTGAFLTKWGTAGGGPNQLKSPQGLAVNAAGLVYVADTGNHRVSVWRKPAGSLSVESVEEGTPVPTVVKSIRTPDVSRPVAAVPVVEMWVRAGHDIRPLSPAIIPQSPAIGQGGIPGNPLA